MGIPLLGVEIVFECATDGAAAAHFSGYFSIQLARILKFETSTIVCSL